MRTRTALAIGLGLLAGCRGDDRSAQALATFERFQQALFAADAGAVRSLVTRESAAAVDGLPWDALRRRQPLMAVEATDMRGSYHVAVRDPNDDGAAGTYVVVREHGRMVVDLVETAALTATVVEAAGGAEELVPRELTPADWDEIRRRELATPPGQPVR
ncbi:MAG: hypothetical protein AB7O97_22335 [Planctomycetota bacterium]